MKLNRDQQRLDSKLTGAENSPYIWVKVPNKQNSWQFFDELLNTKNIVGLPGSGFGTSGEGYFRLTGYGSYEETIEVIKRIKLDVI